MTKRARGLSANVKAVAKIDNHPKSEADKVELRRLVIAEIGEDKARVFEAFAGAGRMFEKVWQRAGDYTGCDLRLFMDDRRAFVADNRRVMRAIDLTAFNVFDLDAYGAPWEQALILAARRKVQPGEKIGIILTEGSGLFLKQGGIPTALKIAAGFTGKKMAAPIRQQDKMIDAALAGIARRMNCSVRKRWGAEGHSGAAMRYLGLILEGL